MGIVGSGHNRICICEIHGQLISINGFFGERIIVGNGKGWPCRGVSQTVSSVFEERDLIDSSNEKK